MEELADAIEDAQYVNAIATQDDGPRPVLPWETPTEDELMVWRQKLLDDHAHRKTSQKNAPAPFTMEWVCQQQIGFFLFSAFLKEVFDDYTRINFVEEVLRFRKLQGKTARYETAVRIANEFLGCMGGRHSSPESPPDESAKPVDEFVPTTSSSPDQSATPMVVATSETYTWPLPKRTEIDEVDLARGTGGFDFNNIQISPRKSKKNTVRSVTAGLTEQELEKMYTVSMDYPVCEQSVVGLKGPLRQEILDTLQEIGELHRGGYSFGESVRVGMMMEEGTAGISTRSDISPTSSFSKKDVFFGQQASETSLPSNSFRQLSGSVRNLSMSSSLSRRVENSVTSSLASLSGSFHQKSSTADEATDTALAGIPSGSSSIDIPTPSPRPALKRAVTPQRGPSSRRSSNQIVLLADLFDKAEHVTMESLRRQYWGEFLQSPHNAKLNNFLWYQDRRVVPEDFFVMRVLGRGGFGLVTACKKGTSGKLYAMKVMNKRRIKMKKSELLAINERQALAAVESKFVINLKYSFHSRDDVFLILDLMTGGDLGFHLHQRGRFSKKECLYYAARIMLGLQALHDEKYVYRDLKPENCLLAEDGRVKITDLGLATKITQNLHGAAGTRGYWAPEMLRRDSRGKRMTYGHAVDWFSFGCCVAEFIAGANPFRSDAALKFGLECGKQTKEKAIDAATLEMDPEFPPEKFEPEAADLCRRLLDKNEKTRLGANGCEEIMQHPWFKTVNWESIISDRKKPPFTPAKDVNAASQSEIGTFAEDKSYQETVISTSDEEVYKDWDWTNPRAFGAEVIEFLIYERVTGEPLVPITHPSTCCCDIL